MQAILIATGEGRKLEPITQFIPTPMLPVLNRPAMSYNVELLSRQGIKEIFVSLYSLGGQIESYFGAGRQWGVSLKYYLQREALGTAGALKWAEGALNTTFLVLPADIIVDFDFVAALDFHRATKSLATIVVHAAASQDVNTYQLNSNWVVTRFETGFRQVRAWRDLGIYIFEPQVLELIPARTHFEIADQLLSIVFESGAKLSGFPLEGYWNPLDDFAAYFQAQKDFLSQEWRTDGISNKSGFFRFLTLAGRQTQRGVWTGRRIQVDEAVEIIPPVYIGDDTRIFGEVELGPYAVIGSNVVIDQGATIRNSVVSDNTYLGKLVNVEDRVVFQNKLIDIATAEHIQIDDQFLLTSTYRAVDEGGLRRVLDLIIAGLIIALTLPLDLVIGLLLWISTGRIFERETCLRYEWKRLNSVSATGAGTFQLLRFNTSGRNGQISWFGKLLERLELVRLPGLWNVIVGDLTFIGVKPLSPEEAARVTEPWQKRRNDYLPGFSGLWLVQTNPNSPLDEVLIADAYYVSIRSWREDFRLMWRTLSGWPRRIRRRALSYSNILEN